MWWWPWKYMAQRLGLYRTRPSRDLNRSIPQHHRARNTPWAIAHKLGAVTGLLLLLLAWSATSVVEAASSRATPVPQYVQRGMNVVGFDPSVAAEHGYRIVTYADGSKQSIPAVANSKLPPGPLMPAPNAVKPFVQSTSWGDCGYSYIEGSQTGAHQIYLRSGFGLSSGLSAVGYNWVIELQDANGFSYVGSSGGLLFRNSWAGEWDALNQYSYSFDYVLSNSTATLADGTVCQSGSPGIYINGIWG